ncbi:uncharacterized protein [Temnothorax longispinosus]|uniref:uncharacterized protein n=1 Tax=Temnothorax longispinosus TaxID=300112 RepID=UPI003A990449
MVYIRDRKSNFIKVRALLDTCATANFISESVVGVVKRLGLRAIAHAVLIGVINATSTESRGLVKITIQSTIDEFRKELTCLTIPTITDLIPSEIFSREAIRIPANIRLADTEFHLPRPVDLLIGSGTTLSLFSVGQINLSHEGHDLYIQKTRLGWVIAGGATTKGATKMTCHVTALENQLCKFWNIEEIATDKPKSKEEIECETHFSNNVYRDSTGRYVVRLPFREVNHRLGESRTIALKRLISLERKLNANVTLKTEYTHVIEEYLKLGHMSIVESPEEDGFYMPHHAVIKESSHTTKVRVVFDASAKTSNGISLNDILMTGPTIQNKLFSHLIRFRVYVVVITADIEKMDGEIKTLQLNTLTFGNTASPFLAIRAVVQLAEDEGQAYPRAAEVLKEHMYVDNVLSGAKNVEEARATRDEIINLLAQGGFTIRQEV